MNALWTKKEDKVLANTSLTYDIICKKLPHRSKRSIWSRAHKLGFPRDLDIIRKVNSENQRKDEWTSLLDDKEFCEIVDGELLGDGCIYKKKVKNRKCYEYTFIAGSIRKEYAEYLHSKLAKKLGSRAKVKPVKPKKSGFPNTKVFYSVRFSNVIFTDFYSRWYPQGSIKVSVPEDLKLTATSCMHWYLGDGSLDSRYKQRMFDLVLHTENFNAKAINMLIDKLKSVGHYFKTRRSKNKYTALRIHGDKARSFLAYIGQSPVKAFNYKWVDWK